MQANRVSRAALGLLWLVVSAQAAAASLHVDVRDDTGHPLPDAVVFLLPLDRPAPPSNGAAATIDQRGLSFSPQVLVVQTGTEVTFPNSDNVRHQVYSFSPAKRFELKLYAGNHASTERFDRAGVVTLGCNIHDWMLGYVVVVDTPWFGKTGPDGQLTIDGVPPGRYTLQLWHPRQADGTPHISESVVVADAPLGRHYTLALQPAERTNRPPPGLEMGLGGRMHGDHAH